MKHTVFDTVCFLFITYNGLSYNNYNRRDKMETLDNKYYIEENVYSGPQSKIYIGSHVKNNNLKVTLKILNSNLASVEGDIEEIFKRDSKALSLINNSNIIEYKDSGTYLDNFYIVMEYFEGVNLYEFIQMNKISYLEKLNIILKVLDGIQAAHDKRIIHRDIKPTNILINKDQEIKIIDFGISKILDINTYRSTNTLKDYITKRYASPEHLLGSNVDIKADIYSIGCVLYYILTGEEPPEDKNEIDFYIEKIKFGDDIKDILKKALAYEKENRYLDILFFINDIEKEIESSTNKEGTLKIFVPRIINTYLSEIGKLTDVSFSNVKSYIERSLMDPYIYKTPNNSYYLIGDEVRYQIIPEISKGYFKIFKVFSIDTYSDNELERAKGIKLPFNIEITSTIPNNPNSKKELESLVAAINLNLSRFKDSIIKAESTNKLITEWQHVIKDINKINYKRQNIGRYRNIEYDERTNTLIVEMEDSFEPSMIQDGDYLKLSKSGKKFINVGPIREIKNNFIVVAFNPKVEFLDLDKRGDAKIDVSMNDTTLKRFNNALYALRDNEAINKNLVDILVDPSILTVKNIDLSVDFINQKLDVSNQEAVVEALKTKDLFLIQGPPGTGKSTVITEIINQVFIEDENAKVLITSPSHVAVDHLLKNIVKDHENKKIIRIGTSEKISKESTNLLASEQIKLWSEEVKKESIEFSYSYLCAGSSDKVLKNYLQYHLKGNKHIKINEIDDSLIPDKVKDLVNILIDWNNRIGLIDEFDHIFAREASIVAATCVGIASRHALRTLTYDWVIIDEAARATAPELLLPMLLGKKIILVGDHKQLPPIVNLVHEQELFGNIDLKILEKSLFEEIFEKSSGGPAQKTLTSQFRMHSVISKLVNTCFYPNFDIKTKSKDIDKQHNLEFPQQIVWIDTSHSFNNEEDPVNKSFRNNLEVKVILKKLEECNNVYKSKGIKASVAVISGYSAQKQLLLNEINPESSKWSNLEIQIDNIDAFQGSEADLVFYSLVRSNKSNKIGFLKDERRLNVALSRGRNCLIIVGNKDAVCDYRPNKSNSFNRIVSFINSNPNNCLIEGAN